MPAPLEVRRRKAVLLSSMGGLVVRPSGCYYSEQELVDLNREHVEQACREQHTLRDRTAPREGVRRRARMTVPDWYVCGYCHAGCVVPNLARDCERRHEEQP